MKRTILIVLALVALTATAQAQTEPAYEVVPCPHPTPQFFEAECGVLTVPEHYDGSSDTTFELSVMVVKAGDEDASPDAPPLFFIPGGPGGSVLATAAQQFPQQFAPLARQQDMIFMDPRGTGLSTPRLYCEEITSGYIELLSVTGGPEAEQELFLDQIAACRDRLLSEGIDFSAFTTDNIAADFNALREALGHDTWKVMGTSYGSRVALEIMRDYPDGLEAAILDSPYPPQVNLFETTVDNIERALTEVFAACADAERCNEAFPDLETVFEGTYTALNEEPATLPVDAGAAGSFELIINGDRIYDWLFNWLYDVDNVAIIPQRVYSLALGNYGPPAQSGSQAEARITRLDMGVYYATQCIEEGAFITAEAMQEQMKRFPERDTYFTSSAALGESLFAMCDGWQTGEVAADTNEPVSSDIPTLIFAGRYDPVTPPEWGDIAAETLPNSTVITIMNAAHGVTRSSSCAMLVARDFLADPSAEPANDCIAAETTLRFPVGVR